MKKILIILLTLILSSILMAQGSQKIRTQAFGLHFGRVSGYGYSYRNFSNDNGFQATLFASTYGSNDEKFDAYGYGTESKKGRRMRISLGANYLRILSQINNNRFYFHVGGAYYVSRTTRLYQDYNTSGLKEGEVYRKKFNDDEWCIGIGPGIETSPRNNVRLSLELPLTYDSDGNIIMYYPQAGVYYYFK